MSYFDSNRAAFRSSFILLVLAFLGAFAPLLLESFSEDGGLVKDLLEVTESLSGRYTGRLVESYFEAMEEALANEL